MTDWEEPMYANTIHIERESDEYWSKWAKQMLWQLEKKSYLLKKQNEKILRRD